MDFSRGELEFMEEENIKKASDSITLSTPVDFYYNSIDVSNRSRMNVPFRITNDDLTSQFVSEAEKNGLYGLKGHRMVGGLRASIYNAMNIEV